MARVSAIAPTFHGVEMFRELLKYEFNSLSYF
jgi:hypothetical protein